VVADKEGAGIYRFYRKGSETPLIKEACWKTIAIHGAGWRLVIACSRYNIEKTHSLNK
jgi:hypothetical protein